MSRGEVGALAALALLAAGLRVIAWRRTVVMFNDGPIFLDLAQRMGAGDWRGALAHDFHPLYPALTLVAHRLGLGWADAAAAVSIAGGAAAVVFLYAFLRHAFGRSLAFVGAGLLAVQDRAVEYGSDVQTDALHLALFLATVALGARALRRRSPSGALACGGVAGLAYLTRPEGLVAASGVGLLGFLRVLRGRWPRAAGASWLAALAMGVAVCVVPYATALRLETGRWGLSQKKSVTVMAGLAPESEAPPAPATAPKVQVAPRAPAAAPNADPVEPEAPPAAASRRGTSATAALLQRVLRAATDVVRTAIAALRYEMLPVFLLGVALRFGRPRADGALVLAVAAVHAALLVALLLSYGYLSKRHVLPPVVLAYGWVALGAAWLASLALATGRRVRAAPAAVGLRSAAVLGLALLAIAPLIRQLEPKRLDKLAERRAAEWLRVHRSAQGGAVAADRSRVAWYAQAPYVSLRGLPSREPLAALQRLEVRYVIVDEPEQLDRLRLVDAPGARLLHRVRASDHEAWVFELPPP